MFQKIKVESEEYAFELQGHTIPLSAIKTICLPILILVIAGLAYNVGQNDAMEYEKVAMYFGHGICNVYGQCVTYKLERLDNKIQWIQQTYNSTIQGNQTWFNTSFTNQGIQ